MLKTSSIARPVKLIFFTPAAMRAKEMLLYLHTNINFYVHAIR